MTVIGGCEVIMHTLQISNDDKRHVQSWLSFGVVRMRILL